MFFSTFQRMYWTNGVARPFGTNQWIRSSLWHWILSRAFQRLPGWSLFSRCLSIVWWIVLSPNLTDVNSRLDWSTKKFFVDHPKLSNCACILCHIQGIWSLVRSLGICGKRPERVAMLFDIIFWNSIIMNSRFSVTAAARNWSGLARGPCIMYVIPPITNTYRNTLKFTIEFFVLIFVFSIALRVWCYVWRGNRITSVCLLVFINVHDRLVVNFHLVGSNMPYFRFHLWLKSEDRSSLSVSSFIRFFALRFNECIAKPR